MLRWDQMTSSQLTRPASAVKSDAKLLSKELTDSGAWIRVTQVGQTDEKICRDMYFMFQAMVQLSECLCIVYMVYFISTIPNSLVTLCIYLIVVWKNSPWYSTKIPSFFETEFILEKIILCADQVISTGRWMTNLVLKFECLFWFFSADIKIRSERSPITV